MVADPSLLTRHLSVCCGGAGGAGDVCVLVVLAGVGGSGVGVGSLLLSVHDVVTLGLHSVRQD